MVKREDSLRSRGLTFIGTDKPTKDSLKKAAAASGLPLSEYMRVLADEAIKNKQGAFPGGPQPSITSRLLTTISAIDAKLDKLIAPGGPRDFKADIKMLDAAFSQALGLCTTEDSIKAWRELINELKQKVELRAKEASQLKLEVKS